MKTTKILYWVFNGLFALVMFGSGIPAVMSSPDEIKGIHEVLGYPVYIIPFIGAAKIMGSVAILVPGYPRLKEWAYAGLTFDLILATFSVYTVPPPEGKWYFMFVFLALAAAAYIYYHKLVKITSTEKP
ncbi:MAG: DoxX family protein [Mucilaginibacter sp.]